MIARIWRGRATGTNAAAYVRHFTRSVVPELKEIEGHRGAWLLQRKHAGETEFLAITLWASLDAIRAFAGDKVDTALVEPEARAVLSGFDESACHYEVTFEG